MLRTSLSKAHIKRTFRPLYGWNQMTPNAGLLDPAWDRSVDIYPGMAMMKTRGNLVTLLNATGVPYGFSALYVGGDGIDEVIDQGINATATWVMGPDAEAEILAPAFDAGASWVDPADGTFVLVHAYVDGARRGQLCPAGTTGRGTVSARPIARLVKVDGPSKIVVGGLQVGDFPTA